MANVSHASLTGSNLHEPKGVATALVGTVYVANGSGSGSWTDVGTASFTGMIADFITPVAPSGWLECDGTVISTTTYSALYNVMVIHSTATRTNGSPILTSIASTTTFKAGYFVFGTGIPSGSTIVTVDSPTQITISNNATSSGTSAFDVSPWLLNTGTIALPNLTSNGKFRRSRSSSTSIGQTQSDQNKAHTHSVSGTTNDPGNHTHANSLTDLGHTHSFGPSGFQANVAGTGAAPPSAQYGVTSANTGSNNSTVMSITNAAAGAHTHTVTGTAASDGGSETRPTNIIVLTCVKI
jgi:microcystin-dependent protein